jgi:hypothetical protein
MRDGPMKLRNPFLKWLLKLFTGIFCLSLSVVFCPPGELRAQGSTSLTPAEQFVLGKIRNGAEADLAKFSANPKNRELRPEFLEKLFAGGFKSSDQTVKIENAILNDALNISENIPVAVWMTDCQFKSGVDFSDAKFMNGLSFEGSTFGSPPSYSQSPVLEPSDAEALFIGMRVNGSLVFNRVKFYLPLDLTYAQIAGQFLFDDVEFQAAGYADFYGLTTTHAPAFFRHDHFTGPVVLTDASLFELFLDGITFDLSGFPPNVPELSLNRTQIARNLSVKDIAFRSIEAQYLEVAGPTTFDNISVSKRLSLAHSRFQTLTVRDLAKWRRENALDIDFEGLSFDGVDVPEANIDDYASRMLDLISSERNRYYSPQPYLVLEKFLRSHGNPEKADEVYISMRRRERQEIVYWKYPEDWLLDILVGYGRKPWRAALYLLALAIIGVVVFREGFMQLQDRKREDSWYSPFWYSLDTLAPVIDLGQAKVWEPKPENAWVRNYAQFQRIAGWILVPLILAAITGIIK